MQRKLMFLKQKMIHKVKERMNNPPKIGSIKTDTTIMMKNWALNIKKVTKNMKEIIQKTNLKKERKDHTMIEKMTDNMKKQVS